MAASTSATVTARYSLWPLQSTCARWVIRAVFNSERRILAFCLPQIRQYILATFPNTISGRRLTACGFWHCGVRRFISKKFFKIYYTTVYNCIQLFIVHFLSRRVSSKYLIHNLQENVFPIVKAIVKSYSGDISCNLLDVK